LACITGHNRLEGRDYVRNDLQKDKKLQKRPKVEKKIAAPEGARTLDLWIAQISTFPSALEMTPNFGLATARS